ncbi:membrane protein [Vibrio coralliilyticus]|uniref:Probable membrane transporter protein n=1 Tax=Vibrio coralliilyticus TaxID=190893 RepID=A0A837G9L2_9VIBR|nr:sulfite exporter TauE/SafE family protein [Vibrio coralliilyticus]KJY68292.1 membrane protein [Vibrio coralliilyticus]QOU30511.1 sulfite exporter TauE/SafE family protein [Vibrio coralliilyticus]
MEIPALLAILATIAIGTYFQTVTGFGLGIIVIGLTVSLNLISLPVIAAVVSIVTLFNCLVALVGKPLKGELKIMLALVVGIVPGVMAGVYLLDELSASATNIMRGMLGIMILGAGLNFMFKPKTLENRSASTSFLFSGFGSGLAGGLFGMAGPPIVYHLYKQPFSIELVRSTLLMVFACTSASRTAYVYLDGSLESNILLLSAVAIPLVTGVTIIARRFPPPLSNQQLRKLVFSVLLMIGSYLIIASLLSLQP